MKLNNISLAKRLFMGNFLMVTIPVCLIAGLGWILITGMHFLDSGQKSTALSLLWPDKAPVLSVQYGANSLLQRAERKERLKEKDVAKDCHILEAQGIKVAVKEKGDVLYISPEADVSFLEDEASQRCRSISPSVLWDSRGFALHYVDEKGDRSIFAVGTMPFTVPGKDEGKLMRQLAEISLFILVGIALIIIIMLGR